MRVGVALVAFGLAGAGCSQDDVGKPCPPPTERTARLQSPDAAADKCVDGDKPRAECVRLCGYPVDTCRVDCSRSEVVCDAMDACVLP